MSLVDKIFYVIFAVSCVLFAALLVSSFFGGSDFDDEDWV